MPNQNGTSRPLYFFLTREYWGIPSSSKNRKIVAQKQLVVNETALDIIPG